MQRHLILLIYVTIILTILVGCGTDDGNNGGADIETDWEPTQYADVNQLEDVTMTAKEGAVSPTEVTLVLGNNSDTDLEYGEYFILEKKINEAWYEVPVTIEGDYGFNDIAYALPSNEKVEVDIDLEWLYGIIDKGKYRIVKDVIEFRDTGDFDKHYLAAEFSMEE